MLIAVYDIAAAVTAISAAVFAVQLYGAWQWLPFAIACGAFVRFTFAALEIRQVQGWFDKREAARGR
jgi:hypothetical protein